MHGRTPSPARPDFLIIGAKRSGTSTLFSLLADHPEVYRGDKEIHYFDFNRDRGIDWYRGLFRDAAPGQIAGEATQTYLFDPEIPPRIAAELPHVKLVAILRDPVQRAYSEYRYGVARGLEDLSLQEALAAEAERAGRSYRDYLAKSYVQRGMYSQQLERVLEFFPRSQLHVVLFEDLIASPDAVYADLCRYLSIDDGFVPRDVARRVNPTLRFRSLAVRRLTKGRGLLGRVAGKLNQRPDDSAPMPSDVREDLARRFESSNRSTAQLLGRDLAEWTWPLSSAPGP